MSRVSISGASDDLIEVEGDLREEFNGYDSGDAKLRYVAFSDGSLVSIRYEDDGCWRVHVVKVGEGTEASKVEGDPDADYTDRVSLTRNTPFTWALFGEDIAKP